MSIGLELSSFLYRSNLYAKCKPYTGTRMSPAESKRFASKLAHKVRPPRPKRAWQAKVRAQTATPDGEETKSPQLDPDERERLFRDHFALVRRIAQRIHDRVPPHVPFEDMLSAGIVGLLEAINNFDPRRGASLASYATIRIQGAILDSLRALDWGPRDLRRKERQMNQAFHQLRTSLGRTPYETELAEAQGMSLSELQHLRAEINGLRVSSLQALTLQPGHEDEIGRHLRSAPEEDPLHLCQSQELRECLIQAVSELPERGQRLLALYYIEEWTMKQVGAALGLGEGRISQLHSAAVLHLRSRMERLLSRPPAERVVDHRGEDARSFARIEVGGTVAASRKNARIWATGSSTPGAELRHHLV